MIKKIYQFFNPGKTHRVLSIFLFFLLAFYGSHAQKEAYNWYFGSRAGITFNPNGRNPKALLDANYEFNQLEGVATISDKDGRLLFYTEGGTVWGRNHLIMPNGSGLLGDNSSTQSAIIVPQPGSKDIYYVFTVPTVASMNGLRYSVVDMRLNNGLGDVVPDKKNIYLFGPVTEKVTAVRHKNGKDIWIISHDWGSNQFRSYLLTDSGIDKKVITCSAGTIHNGGQFNNIGYMKASIDGSMIALVVCDARLIEVFNFNSETGTLTVKYSINKYGVFKELYGVEFSPDASRLYVTESWQGDARLYQFDLRAGTPVQVASSEVVIADFKFFGAVQLGPDGKIYVSINGSKYLDAINDPNKRGADCHYQENAVSLDGREAALGLPNFLPSLLLSAKIMINTPVCEGETLTLTANVPQASPSASYSWTGPKGFTANTKDVIIPNVTKDMEGTYYLSVDDVNGSTTDSIYAEIYPKPEVSILPSAKIMICQGDSIELKSSLISNDYSCLWSTGANTYSIYVKEPGKYQMIITSLNGCKDTAEAEVGFYPYNKIEIKPEGPTRLCQGDSTVLSVSQDLPGYHYKWSTGESTSKIKIYQAGLYSLMAVSPEGCRYYDTVYIQMDALPEAAIEPKGETTFCEGDSVVLDAHPTGNFTYLWSTGETSPSITVRSSMKVGLTVTSENGCRDTASVYVQVSKLPVPELNYQSPLLLCPGDTVMLATTKDFSRYRWSTGEVTKSIAVSDSGTYFVEVYNEYGCSGIAGVHIVFDEAKIDIPASLEMVTYKSVDEATKTITIRNTGQSDVNIRNTSMRKNPAYFDIKTSLPASSVLKKGETADITIQYINPSKNDYIDTLIISAESSCQQNFLIPVTVRNASTVTWMPDVVGFVGDFNVVIPLEAKFGSNVNSTMKSFKATIEFDASLLVPEDDDNIITNKIENGRRIIEIAGDEAINLDRNDYKLFELRGRLLLAKEDKIPIYITGFSWDNKYILNDTLPGSLEIKGLCQRNLSRVKFMDNMTLQILPNPATDETSLEITTDRQEDVFLGIYDVRGNRLMSRTLTKKSGTETFRLNVEELSAGVYEAVVRSGSGVVTKTLVVVK